MTPFWFSVLLLFIGLAGFVVAGATWDTTDASILVGTVAGICLLVGVLIPPIVYGSRHFNRVSCNTFSEQTNRPTKFVLYNSWATGDCLTPTADGKWISVDALREFGEQP